MKLDVLFWFIVCTRFRTHADAVDWKESLTAWKDYAIDYGERGVSLIAYCIDIVFSRRHHVSLVRG